MTTDISPKQAMRAAKLASRNGRRPTIKELVKVANSLAGHDRLAYYARARPDYTHVGCFFTCTR